MFAICSLKRARNSARSLEMCLAACSYSGNKSGSRSSLHLPQVRKPRQACCARVGLSDQSSNCKTLARVQSASIANKKCRAPASRALPSCAAEEVPLMMFVNWSLYPSGKRLQLSSVSLRAHEAKTLRYCLRTNLWNSQTKRRSKALLQGSFGRIRSIRSLQGFRQAAGTQLEVPHAACRCRHLAGARSYLRNRTAHYAPAGSREPLPTP